MDEENKVAPAEVTGAESEEVIVEKTFTQSELDKIIEKRLAKEKAKAEKDKEEALELAKLSESERLEALQKKKMQDMEKQLAELSNKDIRNQLTNRLLEANIPSTFADFLVASDLDKSLELFSSFKTEYEKFITSKEEEFNVKVDAEVLARMKGKTPSSPKTEKATFTLDDIKKMSPAEINKNWATIQKMKL